MALLIQAIINGHILTARDLSFIKRKQNLAFSHMLCMPAIQVLYYHFDLLTTPIHLTIAKVQSSLFFLINLNNVEWTINSINRHRHFHVLSFSPCWQYTVSSESRSVGGLTEKITAYHIGYRYAYS